MTFAVTPVGGFNPTAPTEPSRNIQFQLGDENVGVRNIDTVNLRSITGDVSDVLKVRTGVGEQVNVLTVESEEVVMPGGVWLDTFTGSAGTLLTDHDQDTPFNNSVWEGGGGELLTPSLYGGGYLSTNDEFPGGDTLAVTSFAEGSLLKLAWGWELEITLVNAFTEYSPTTAFRMVSIIGEVEIELSLVTQELTATLDDVTQVLTEVTIPGPEDDPVEYSVRMVMNENSAEVYLNDVLVHTFVSGTFQIPVYAAVEMSGASPAIPRLNSIGFHGTVIQVIT